MTGDSDDIDIEQLRKDELRRNRLMGAGILIVIVAGLGFAFLLWSSGLVGEAPEITSGEDKQNWQQSNDPQCRALIKRVRELRPRFEALRSKIEAQLPGSEGDKLRRIGYKLSALREQIEAFEDLALRSSFRTSESKKQVFDWIEYVRDELFVLEDLVDEQLEQVEGRNDAETSSTDRKEGDTESPGKRRDTALVAIHSAFENFRTWHTGDVHPCGSASDDEEPWEPSKSRKKTKESESATNRDQTESNQ